MNSAPKPIDWWLYGLILILFNLSVYTVILYIMYIYILCMYVYIYIMYIYIYVCVMCGYIYTYIHTYIHTHRYRGFERGSHGYPKNAQARNVPPSWLSATWGKRCPKRVSMTIWKPLWGYNNNIGKPEDISMWIQFYPMHLWQLVGESHNGDQIYSQWSLDTWIYI